MKVVLFCGGLGTRLREHSDTIPKPLVNIGPRPIIWHLMKYYAHYGYTDFILCLGYRGELIREFFLGYHPFLSEDFVLERGERRLLGAGSDVGDWSITFVDTGLHSNIGERLLAVKSLLADEETFLANYSDQLSDLPLDKQLEHFTQASAVASFVAVKPSQSFHTVLLDPGGQVRQIESVRRQSLLINGGFMILRREVFDFIEPGDELVEEPFSRLLQGRALVGYEHTGFWKSMDTFKDKIEFDRMHGRNHMPWKVWD